MSRDVAVEVVTDEVVIAMIGYGGHESAELVSITKGIRVNSVEDLLEIWVNGVGAVVVGMAEVFDIFGKVSKEEYVGITDLTSDFNLPGVSILSL